MKAVLKKIKECRVKLLIEVEAELVENRFQEVFRDFQKAANLPGFRAGKAPSDLIEKKELQDEWLIDCIVDGEAEDVAIGLFEAALRGEPLPRRVAGYSPSLENIPRIRHRSTLGVVEVTRG